MDILKGTISDTQKAAFAEIAQGEQAGKDLIGAVDKMIRGLLEEYTITIQVVKK